MQVVIASLKKTVFWLNVLPISITEIILIQNDNLSYFYIVTINFTNKVFKKILLGIFQQEKIEQQEITVDFQ